MELHILEHRLKVASVAKERIQGFTYGLIKLAFLASKTRFPEPRRILVKPYVPQPGSKPVSLVAKRAPPASKEATQRPQDVLEMSAPASPKEDHTCPSKEATQSPQDVQEMSAPASPKEDHTCPSKEATQRPQDVQEISAPASPKEDHTCPSKEGTQRPQDVQEMSAPASPKEDDTGFLEETESDILWTKEYVHSICQRFSDLDLEKKEEVADAVALEHFDLFVEHVFESTESAWEEFMCYVVSSPNCNVREAMKFLVPKAYGSEEESKEELLKATRQMGAIIRYGSDLEELRKWVRPIYMVLTNRLLKAPERPHGELTREDYRTYMNQGEAMNTIQTFMKRLHLVEDMKFRLAGASDLDTCREFQSPPGSSPTPSSSLESTGVDSGSPCPEF